MFAAFVITQKIILFLRFTEIFLVGLQWNVWKSIYVEINFVHTKYLYSMFFSFCTLLYLRLTISSTLCFILQKMSLWASVNISWKAGNQKNIVTILKKLKMSVTKVKSYSYISLILTYMLSVQCIGGCMRLPVNNTWYTSLTFIPG